MKVVKPVSELTIADLEVKPVWRYVNADEFDETLVTPLARVPVSSLSGKIVGAKVRFNNGEIVWALIGNVDANNSRLNEHLLTLSLWSAGKWLHLARYHDVDFDENGPEALATKLNRQVIDVFPIFYDIRNYAKGQPDALCNLIPALPKEKLTQSELMKLIVDS